MIDHELVTQLEKLDATINSCRIFPMLQENLKPIRDAMGHLKKGYEDADRPLRILLAGGTGVGKSTLLNAFAGAGIARSSQVRPTTTFFTIYIHQDDREPWLESLSGAQIEKHSRPELLHKIIIDAPDADSAIMEHRHILERAMELSDLVLAVVTPEKYVSRSVMDLMVKFQKGRRFAFVLNKLDLNNHSEILADLKRSLIASGFEKSRLFHISARNAFSNKSSGEAFLPDGDFMKLEAFVGDTMTRVKIREIHRLNLTERAEILADNLAAFLPENFNQTGQRWRDECEIEMNRFLEQLGTRLRKLILVPEELSPAMMRRKASLYSGLFGFTVNSLYFIRQLVKRTFTPGKELAAEVTARLNSKDKQAVSSGFELLADACITAAGTAGLSRSEISTIIHQANSETIPDMVEWTGSQIAPALTLQIEKMTPKTAWFSNTLLNIPPLAWIFYWIYQLTVPIIRGGQAPLESMPGAMIILLLILLLEYYVFDKLIQISAKSRTEKVISNTIAHVADEFKLTFSSGLESALETIESCTDKLHAAIVYLRQISKK